MSKIVFDADKIRKTVIISLPAVPGSELEFYTDNLVGTERELTNLYPKYQEKDHPDAFSFVMASLIKLLKAWNFTDAEDKDIPLEQAKDIFEKIPGNDIKHILTKIEEVKKETIGSLGLEQS